MADTTTTQFQVEMMCDGCAKAVKAVLSRVPGVEDVQVSWQKKEVVVKGSASSETMLAAIQKTGKKCSLVA